jgi:hypothetical protein
MRHITWIVLLLTLAGCDSFTAAPYSISANNDVALKSALGTERIGIGIFSMGAKFDPGCRLAGPIQLPNGLTFEGYIQNAFADELKVAGLYDDHGPIVLQGVVDDLRFSTTEGTWDIGLTVKSSNGKTITVTEHYDFHSSFSAMSACHNASDAFQPAVQALIGKVIAAPEFQLLLAVGVSSVEQ